MQRFFFVTDIINNSRRKANCYADIFLDQVIGVPGIKKTGCLKINVK